VFTARRSDSRMGQFVRKTGLLVVPHMVTAKEISG
jgi:hypothetical protein